MEPLRHGTPLAETLCGLGKLLDRLDLVAQECDGDDQQNERGAHHPRQEDACIGCIGLTAPRKDAQHLVLKLDPDLDEIGIAHRIDPEGPIDLAGDLFTQEVIENGEKGLWSGRW